MNTEEEKYQACDWLVSLVAIFLPLVRRLQKTRRRKIKRVVDWFAPNPSDFLLLHAYCRHYKLLVHLTRPWLANWKDYTSNFSSSLFWISYTKKKYMLHSSINIAFAHETNTSDTIHICWGGGETQSPKTLYLWSRADRLHSWTLCGSMSLGDHSP